MDLTVPKILLISLSLWGFWTLWAFPYTNGLLKILNDITLSGASIPGPTRSPMKQHYTGVKPIDKQLTILTSFFYTAIDGNRADVSLVGLDLGGSVIAAWMLVTAEGLRAGNSGKYAITGITLLGVLLQNIGFACIAPLWMFLHLTLSPTVVNPKPFQLACSRPIQLALAPFAVALGYGTPSVLMCLPAPTVISFDFKQTMAAAQQAWPFWILICQTILNVVANIFAPTVSTVSESTKLQQSRQYLRYVYGFGIVSAFSGSAIPALLTTFAHLFPVLFSRTYLPQLQPAQVFLPVNPFNTHTHAKTLADGALWFLQWDFYTGVAATLVWAMTLLRGSTGGKLSASTILKTALLTLCLGPAGAAVAAVWERDERVFSQADGKKDQ